MIPALIGTDIAEVCGGEGRTSTIATRRRLHSGKNLDLVTGLDLTKESNIITGYNYFERNVNLCAVMAPECKCFGPMSNMVKTCNPETHERELNRVGRPLAKFCGNVAVIQLKKGLHFIREQPFPTTIDHIQPWPTV